MTKLLGRFWTTVILLIIIYIFLKWGIPSASRAITELPFPLSVPKTLLVTYMILAMISFYLYITFSEDILNEFLTPIKKLLRAEYGKTIRFIVLLIIPFSVGLMVYSLNVPKTELPVSLRMQHPSSNFPKKLENLKNPYTSPTETQVNNFITQAKTNEVPFIPQIQNDISAWKEENPDKPILEIIPSKTMKKFLNQLKPGIINKSTAKAALIEKYLFEGRVLYAMNCIPCHGHSVAGNGMMAPGFTLKPSNFAISGTIETLIEGYTFWRIRTGGAGLPVEATPWNSAMPEWKLNLTDEEVWKIMMALYNLAQKTPRIPDIH